MALSELILDDTHKRLEDGDASEADVLRTVIIYLRDDRQTKAALLKNLADINGKMATIGNDMDVIRRQIAGLETGKIAGLEREREKMTDRLDKQETELNEILSSYRFITKKLPPIVASFIAVFLAVVSFVGGAVWWTINHVQIVDNQINVKQEAVQLTEDNIPIIITDQPKN